MFVKTAKVQQAIAHTQQVKDSMSKHSKNYRQNELKIRRIEATSDRLTGRAGLALFVAYLHGIQVFDGLIDGSAPSAKTGRALASQSFSSRCCAFLSMAPAGD
jgi:hypothetical protein